MLAQECVHVLTCTQVEMHVETHKNIPSLLGGVPAGELQVQLGLCRRANTPIAFTEDGQQSLASFSLLLSDPFS